MCIFILLHSFHLHRDNRQKRAICDNAMQYICALFKFLFGSGCYYPCSNKVPWKDGWTGCKSTKPHPSINRISKKIDISITLALNGTFNILQHVTPEAAKDTVKTGTTPAVWVFFFWLWISDPDLHSSMSLSNILMDQVLRSHFMADLGIMMLSQLRSLSSWMALLVCAVNIIT